MRRVLPVSELPETNGIVEHNDAPIVNVQRAFQIDGILQVQRGFENVAINVVLESYLGCQIRRRRRRRRRCRDSYS